MAKDTTEKTNPLFLRSSLLRRGFFDLLSVIAKANTPTMPRAASRTSKSVSQSMISPIAIPSTVALAKLSLPACGFLWLRLEGIFSRPTSMATAATGTLT